MILMDYLEGQIKRMENLYQKNVKKGVVNGELFLDMARTYVDVPLTCSHQPLDIRVAVIKYIRTGDIHSKKSNAINKLLNQLAGQLEESLFTYD